MHVFEYRPDNENVWYEIITQEPFVGSGGRYMTQIIEYVEGRTPYGIVVQTFAESDAYTEHDAYVNSGWFVRGHYDLQGWR
jgi:hypothetical protein